MPAVGTLVAASGIVALFVGLLTTAGVVANVVIDGDTHKEEMMASPPPPPTRRRLFDPDLFTAPKETGFALGSNEKSALASLTRRPLNR